MIWARTYGIDGARTLRPRSLRAQLACLRGLAAEDTGDNAGARALYQQAADEAATIVRLRRNASPLAQATALQRYGLALACLGDPRAVQQIAEAQRILGEDLNHPADSWEMSRCAPARPTGPTNASGATQRRSACVGGTRSHKGWRPGK